MEKIYDMLIVGGGPAGLTASLYGQRNGKTTLTLEKAVFGGQIVNSPKVENIPGFKSISGDEYGDLLLQQVQYQNGEVMFDEVRTVEIKDKLITLKTDMGLSLTGKSLIIASGTKHRRLHLTNEENLIGKQIHFCAVCDGNFYQGKKVVMIGGGNSAFVEANLLADVVEELVILQDLPNFTAEAKLQEQVLNKKNVHAQVKTKILEYVLDNDKLIGVKYLQDGEEKFVDCAGVFLAIGLIPDNHIFKDIVELDENGYIVADEFGITNREMVFVAGDCRHKKLRQVATALSDGANAAMSAIDYLKKLEM